MAVENDLALIAALPAIKVWGEALDQLKPGSIYKGKFVVTDDGQFFAKLIPEAQWNSHPFFHDQLVGELGVRDPEHLEIKEVITGGGKIEVEQVGEHLECRLGGKSTVYGDHDPDELPCMELEEELKEVFDLDDCPVTIELDMEL